MNTVIQYIILALVLLGCAFYIWRRICGKHRKATDCSHCDATDCPLRDRGNHSCR